MSLRNLKRYSSLAFFVFFLLAFSETSAFSLDVKVGVIAPTTGALSPYGTDVVKGIEFAEMQAAKSDVNLKLIYEDSQSTPSQASQNANKLIQSDKVSALIGDVTSSSTISAAAIAEKAGIPIISPSATNQTITENKKFVFRACFADDFQGGAMADFIRNYLKAKTVVILEDTDSDYSRGISASFQKKFEKDGGKVLKTIRYSATDINYTAQLGNLKRANPDVVFIPGYPQQVGVILRGIKDFGIKAIPLGADGWGSPDLRTIAKGSENGGYFSNQFSPDSSYPTSKKFVDSYKAKYGVLPSSFVALGYDTYNILLAAIKRANSATPAQINSELEKTKNFDGVSGYISFDANHNVQTSAVILQYVPNGIKFISTVDDKGAVQNSAPVLPKNRTAK